MRAILGRAFGPALFVLKALLWAVVVAAVLWLVLALGAYVEVTR